VTPNAVEPLYKLTRYQTSKVFPRKTVYIDNINMTFEVCD